MKIIKNIVLVVVLTIFASYQCVNAQGKRPDGVAKEKREGEKQAKEKVKGAKKEGQDAVKGAKSGAKNAKDKARNTADKGSKKAKEGVKNAKNEAKESVKNAKDNLKGNTDKAQDKVANAKGNAVVKDKAYGLAKANEVKEKLTKQTANFAAKEKVIINGRERISAAKVKLETLKKEGKLTPEQISEKQAKISKAELQLEKLNTSLTKGKAQAKASQEKLILLLTTM